MDGVVVVAVTVVFGLVGPVVVRRVQVVTSRRYRAIARRHGLHYRRRPVGIEDLGFLLFLTSAIIRLDHELSAPDRRGRPRVFEYRRHMSFVVRGQLRLTCAVVRLEFVAPRTVIAPRIGLKAAGARRRAALDGPDIADFDAQWRVTCDDLAFARVLLDDR